MGRYVQGYLDGYTIAIEEGFDEVNPFTCIKVIVDAKAEEDMVLSLREFKKEEREEEVEIVKKEEVVPNEP